MSNDTLKKSRRTKLPGCSGCLRSLLILMLIASALLGLLLFSQRQKLQDNSRLQEARQLGLILWQYANDHNGKFPEGKTSTEVFQKLLDDGYVIGGDEGPAGPKAFYFPMPGKVEPTSNQLKPENVCWDVTANVPVLTAPNDLPVLYMTGYRVTYQSGAGAIAPAWPPQTWWQWLTLADYPRTHLIVRTNGGDSLTLKANPNGTIPNFMPASITEDISTYHQLTPDGK